MRHIRGALLALVVGWHGVVGGGTLAWSQTLPPTPPPAGTLVQQPPAQPPAAPAQPPPAAAPEATVESAASLFAPTWRQAQISGRWSSVSGDPARFQRYEDLRDGLLFTDVRYAREQDDWLFRVGADNVGWRDQRFFGTYERTGLFVISGLWDEIPQFYSVDTRTPYTPAPGESPLTLDDTVQRTIQSGQANTTAYVPIATQFDLRERRDIGRIMATATPTRQIDVKATFTTTKHTGELPWGASFGFSNDVEVALPYDSRTNDFSIGAEWMNSRGMVRVAYDGSWFNNLDDTLVWDSPLRLDDSPSAPGRGRMALWPSNSAQTISAAASAKLQRRTQVTGFLSFGFWNNDEPLQPFTINPMLPQLTLPRSTTQAEAQVFSTNLTLVSRPEDDWRFSARLRRYDYDNETLQADIPEFINYDTSVKTSSTGGPELFAHSRTTFDADATWTGLLPFALTAGYTHNSGGYDFRIFEDSGEHVLTLKADAVGWQWATFRAHYELADRSGSGLDEERLTEIGEQPALRHYDIANRTRNRFTGQVDVTPIEAWIFSASFGVGNDDYDDSYFGLQESSFRVVTLAADFQQPNGFGAGASYDYERYSGLQRSRSASPGQVPDQVTDPNRDWTADSRERVHYFSIYLTPPRIGPHTEARFSYDYAYSRGNYLYTVVPGGPLPEPSQLPQVFNKLQELKLDVRHRVSNSLVATISYLYEPFDVYDFAFDPSVVDGIVQPSSLVLGYVYRPYTAHSVVFGLRYFW
jgi:MtrB/PioB family decaheme-associated outer membrane protein